MIEITITHNLERTEEVVELYKRRLIALDWNRLGPDPDNYEERRAKTDIRLFNRLREEGAAVIAAYKSACKKKSTRLIGKIAPGVLFEDMNGLLCLPLSDVREVDVSANFLGNLAPNRCTIQNCGARSQGKLAAVVNGIPVPRTVGSLHHRDVEWLVVNYMVRTGLCESFLSSSHAFEGIDHAGWKSDGTEVLAQTTISRDLIKHKAGILNLLSTPQRELHFFGPTDAASDIPDSIRYHTLDAVFSFLDQSCSGKKLIDGMIGTGLI